MRISATTLEDYRLFRDPMQDWMTEADLKARVLGTSAPNRPMLIGRAFEAILMTPEMFACRGGYLAEGYTFDAKEMDPILATIDRRAVFQVKQVQKYGAHDVACKADQLLGTTITDWKTTLGSSIELERYLESFQWRFYCDVFHPAAFEYRIFRLNDHKNTVIEIKDEQRIKTYPYPALRWECMRLVDDFSTFATARGWDVELNRRQAVA